MISIPILLKEEQTLPSFLSGSKTIHCFKKLKRSKIYKKKMRRKEKCDEYNNEKYDYI